MVLSKSISFSPVCLCVCVVICRPLHAEEWKLSFSDEFTGDRLDLVKWSPRDPWGVERNQELQAYVADAFEVKDGLLRIIGKKAMATYDGKPRQYTSGMMTTHGKFSWKFGKFEIRCRVPKGRGLWPAFWLLPDPLGWPPEIDVLEILGHEPSKVYLTHHWTAAPPPAPSWKTASDSKEWAGPDFSADFHVFTCQWEPDSITWSIDGVERFRSIQNVPTEKPMYLLVNLAIGGDWPKAPDASTIFPAAFEIDYVKVWSRQ